MLYSRAITGMNPMQLWAPDIKYCPFSSLSEIINKILPRLR